MSTRGSGIRRKKHSEIIKNTVLAGIGDNIQSEKIQGRIFAGLCIIATFFGIVSLASLLVYVFYDAAGWLDLQFVTSAPSRFADQYLLFRSLRYFHSPWVWVPPFICKSMRETVLSDA